jgi:hypothetical protein
MTDDTWNKLEELLTTQVCHMAAVALCTVAAIRALELAPAFHLPVQNAGISAQALGASPFRVRTRATISLAWLELRLLQAPDSKASCEAAPVVVQAALRNMQCSAVWFSTTTSVSLGVGAASISAPQGQLFQTGVLQSSQAAFLPSTDGNAVLGTNKALALRLIRSPQDAQADIVVKLAIAPSYITYLPR